MANSIQLAVGLFGSAPGDRLETGTEFEQELIRCLPRMLATATGILRDRAEAEDAVQDACLSAFRNRAALNSGGAMGAWLHRITVNAALMRLRKRARLAEDQIDDLMPQYDDYGVLLGDVEQHEISAEALLARAETREKVIEAIDQLPERARILIVLRDIEEMTTSEVAEALELSEGAVKTGLHRARLTLKGLLAPLFSEGGL